MAGEMFEANISSIVRVNIDYTSPRNQRPCRIVGSWKKSDFGDAPEVARYSKFMRYEVFKSFKIQIEMQKE
jgi:hypothetical protein